jgi:hypothetical protein
LLYELKKKKLDRSPKGQFVPTGDTATEIAVQQGVSDKTVKRAAEFTRAVDELPEQNKKENTNMNTIELCDKLDFAQCELTICEHLATLVSGWLETGTPERLGGDEMSCVIRKRLFFDNIERYTSVMIVLIERLRAVTADVDAASNAVGALRA